MTSTAQLQLESPPEGFRISPQQKRLWEAIQQSPRGLFGAQCYVRIIGPLDTRRLDQSIRRLQGAHEILRTRFVLLPGTRVPVQVIENGVAGLSKPRQVAVESEVESIAETLRHHAKDNVADSGVDFTLLHISDEKHFLIVTSSGLCADGTALSAIISELHDVYTGDTLNQDESLQYADIAEWQNQVLEGEAKEHDSYWRAADFSALRFPHLPFERRYTESAEVNPGTLVRRFSGSSLAAAMSQSGASAEAVLLAAYQILIGRLSNLEQFLIGVRVDGRTPAELQDAIGLFAKAMPLAATVDQNQSFNQLVRKTSTALELAAYDQAYFDAEILPSAESPRRCTMPLTFNVQSVPSLRPAGSTQWEIMSLQECLEPFELAVTAEIADDFLTSLRFAWNKSVFDEQEISLVADYYVSLLRQVSTRPNTFLRDLTLGNHAVLPSLNAKAIDEASGCGVHLWIEEQCTRVPQNVAAVCGEQQLTYAELNRRASLLANRLTRIGAAPEKVIAIAAPRSLDFIVAIFAVLKSGAAWLPLDPDTPAERIKYMINQAGAIAVLVESETSLSSQLDIPIISMDEEPAEHEGTKTAARNTRVFPEQLAYVIFTSGSTGRPKGVGIEHRQLAAYVHALRADLDLTQGASYALVSTMAADLGHTPVFAALTSGGCVHVIPPGASKDVTVLAQYFMNTPVDCIKIVPAHLEALCRSFPPDATFPWRTLVVGGEPLTWDLIELVKKLAPGCAIMNEYGPTETTVGVVAATAELDKEPFNAAEAPIGSPRGGVSAYVLDQSFRPVSAWITGDLYIGGNHVGRGYVGAADLTAERFLPDPFHSIHGSRLYMTGDRARYRTDGTLEFLGRRDGQIKLRGYRIELSEIEATLCRHPQVNGAIVMPVSDKNSGKMLAAWVAVGQSRLLSEELRRFASESLPSYMVPSVFTCVEQFKLTSNGKIDRHALPPATEHVSGSADTPLDEMEESLLAVWRRVLGKGTVNVNDNYFALGGDSLRVVQVVHEARRYGITIRAMDILRHQTIRNLRKALQQEHRYELFPNGVPEALLPEPRELSSLPSDVVDFYPISEIQNFVLQKYAENQGIDGIYHIQECFHLEDPNFSVRALEAAFEAVVERHPVLRTVFYFKSSPPLQCVRRALPWKILTEHLFHLDDSAQHEYIAARIQADRADLFDVANIDAPLFRIVVFLRSATQFSVLFSCHHAIMDGWGHQIFLNHLLEAYTSIKSGNTPALGAPDRTYHEFVNFEQAIGCSEQVAQFWRSYLSGAAFSPLPRFVLPGVQETNDPIVVSELESEQSEALEHLAREHAISMQALFLAAWLELLRQWSGEPAVTTGVISNGRSEYLADPLSAVGLFWNVAPIVSREKLPLLKQAEAVQKDLIDIQPYASYPLTRLIADNGGRELFYSAFRYLNFWNSKQIPEASGLHFTGAHVVDRYPFALTCTAAAGPRGRYIQLEYNPKAISLESARDLLNSYRNLLEEITEFAAPVECN
jgi:amino acid adenylation domain-containing protein